MHISDYDSVMLTSLDIKIQSGSDGVLWLYRHIISALSFRSTVKKHHKQESLRQPERRPLFSLNSNLMLPSLFSHVRAVGPILERCAYSTNKIRM